LGSCVQLYSLAETPQLPPSPRIRAHIRGRYWSAKIDDISLQPADCTLLVFCDQKYELADKKKDKKERKRQRQRKEK
jgi:hypothetical protein